MQFRRGRRVLHMNLFLREDIRRSAKGSERCLMESGQNQLLLSGVSVDIAHSEDTWDIGLEFFRIDCELLALDV